MSSEPPAQERPSEPVSAPTEPVKDSTPAEEKPSQPAEPAAPTPAAPPSAGPIEQISSSQPPPTEPTAQSVPVPTDNGIFEFMTADKAIELYKRLHSEGQLELKWKFHGRKSLNECKSNPNATPDEEVNAEIKETGQDQTVNTEFDFDEEFGTMDEDTLAGESLRLQKRPEAGTEKRANLSDIMNDIRKERITQEPIDPIPREQSPVKVASPEPTAATAVVASDNIGNSS